MIKRKIASICEKLAAKYPILTITGPRQSGKTTLTKMLFPNKTYINLENPDQRRLAMDDPRGFLNRIKDGAILDEIQRVPEIPSYLQQMVDDNPAPGRFILTGSQQLEISQSISQSLAGRTAIIRLLPLSLQEVKGRQEFARVDSAMLRGFYPGALKAQLTPHEFYPHYFETYIERDLRQLSQIENLSLFDKFIRLLAGRVGQLMNASSLANDLGVSSPTVRKWVSLLEASYIVYSLAPFFRNIGKRLIKTPKIYFYDVGLAAYLLGIENENQLQQHPLRGNLFENMMVMEFIKARFNRGERLNLSFYRDRTGNEVDIVAEQALSLRPVEIKASQTMNTDFFKPLEHFAAVFKKEFEKGFVIYGGDSLHEGSLGTVLPWNADRVAEIV